MGDKVGLKAIKECCYNLLHYKLMLSAIVVPTHTNTKYTSGFCYGTYPVSKCCFITVCLCDAMKIAANACAMTD